MLHAIPSLVVSILLQPLVLVEQSFYYVRRIVEQEHGCVAPHDGSEVREGPLVSLS